MKNLFKDCKTVSDCEEKLNKLIEASQTVYGYGITPMASSLWNMNGPEEERCPHTHQAKLMFMEPIKQPCPHRVRLNSFSWVDGQMREVLTKTIMTSHCELCGAELKATWSEK